MQSAETTQKIQEVKGALDQMRRIADISHPSRAAVKVMDFLMAEVEERRKPASSTSVLGKRKAESPGLDESSDLQRAVKKLIEKAQLEVESPNQSMGSSNTPPGWSPSGKTGNQMDMRIFSDTPRDRPVFDAYPMPNFSADSLAPPNNTFAPQSAASPFTFPVDPTNATFPPFDPRSFVSTQAPPLDPAVENILTSYFPQPQTSSNTAGSAAIPQVPENFLSKVFNFGWDSQAVGGGTMGGDGVNGSGQGMGQGVAPSAGSGTGNNESGNGVQNISGAADSYNTSGFEALGFDGWGAHGWMV